MKLIKCHISSFGIYTDKDFDFSDGVNPFFLKNGKGKSTLADFIKFMLYGMNSIRKKTTTFEDREHYSPNNNGIYGGTLNIEYDNRIYIISRSFDRISASKDKLEILDVNGTEIEEFNDIKVNRDFNVGFNFLGIDEDAFKRCNFIYSNDLKFEINDSIKTKINGLVLDTETEVPYNEVMKNIDLDLKSNRKGALAYGNTSRDKIEIYKKENSEYLSKLANIDSLKADLVSLNETLDNINNEYKDANLKKDELIRKETALALLRKYNEEKQSLEDVLLDINSVKDKYNGQVISKEDLNNIINYNYLLSKNKSELEKKGFSDDDKKFYIENKLLIEDKIYESNIYQQLCAKQNQANDLENLKSNLSPIHENELNRIKDKIENKNVDLTTIESKFAIYNEKLKASETIGQSELNDGDFDVEVNEKLLKEIENLKAEKEQISAKISQKLCISTIFLFIITFGIYYFVYKNKQNKAKIQLDELEKRINEIEQKLTATFRKYNVEGNSFSIMQKKLESLVFNAQNNSLAANARKSAESLSHELKEKLSILGYIDDDLSVAYSQFINDYNVYKNLLNDKKYSDSTNKKYDDNIKTIEKEISDELDKHFNNNLSIEYKMNTLRNFVSNYASYLEKELKINELKKIISEYTSKINSILVNYNISMEKISITELINDMDQLGIKIEKFKLRTDINEKMRVENHLDSYNYDLSESITKEDLEKEINRLWENHKILENDIIAKETECENYSIYTESINENKQKILIEEENIKIMEMTAKIIQDAENSLEEKYLGPVKDEFIKYSGALIGTQNVDILMDFDYNLKFVTNGNTLCLDALSDGEKTIVLIALRLAVINNIYKDNKVFLILDDPFVHLDEENFNKVKSIVKEFSKKRQIIYFTCHPSRKIDL